jgi:enoyl-CoA hydratase/carnithine racemase
VARAAGEMTAREMLLEAAVLPAAEMKARGFLNRVAADGEVAAQALASARRAAALSPQAARLNKQALRDLASGTSPAGAYRYADSAEHREGIAAFLEKRRAAF